MTKHNYLVDIMDCFLSKSWTVNEIQARVSFLLLCTTVQTAGESLFVLKSNFEIFYPVICNSIYWQYILYDILSSHISNNISLSVLMMKVNLVSLFFNYPTLYSLTDVNSMLPDWTVLCNTHITKLGVGDSMWCCLVLQIAYPWLVKFVYLLVRIV